MLTYFQYSLHTISPSFTPPAVLSTIVPSFVEKFDGLANAYIDSQKLDAKILARGATRVHARLEGSGGMLPQEMFRNQML